MHEGTCKLISTVVKEHFLAEHRPQRQVQSSTDLGVDLSKDALQHH
jgi:hypothetical protein